MLGLVYMINNSTWAKDDISIIFQLAAPYVRVAALRVLSLMNEFQSDIRCL